MSFPDGVTLCEVTLPASATWQGGASAISVTATPTRTVFHRKTGQQLTAVTGNASGPSGVGVVLLVPHGHQSGYRDAAGNSISGWEYDVVAEYQDASNTAQTLRKRVRIPVGTQSVNLLSAVDYEADSEFDGVLGDGVPRLGIDSDGTPYVIS